MVEFVTASAAGMTVVEVVALADVVTGSVASVEGVVAALETDCLVCSFLRTVDLNWVKIRLFWFF